MTTTETILPDISKTFWGGIIKIVTEYKERYEVNPEKEIEFIRNREIPKALLILVYNRSVREGLKPIEELEQKEKEDLWIQSDKNLNTCKALYILKEL